MTHESILLSYSPRINQGAPASISIPFSLIAEVERSQSLERLRALQRQYSPTESFLERTRIEGSFEEKSLKPDSASSSFFLLRTKPTMIHSLLRYGGQYKLEVRIGASGVLQSCMPSIQTEFRHAKPAYDSDPILT